MDSRSTDTRRLAGDLRSSPHGALLPANPPGRWMRMPPPILPDTQKRWLLRPGALTAGLRAQGRLTLQVMREWAGGLSAQEAALLQRPAGSPVWTREILMSIDGVRCVFARSFTPLPASHGLWQGMRRLRTRPLADMLYHDPQISRSPFLVARLAPHDPMHRSVMRLDWTPQAAPTANRLLARCSVFYRCRQPLLVAECFLPGFWDIVARH